MGPHGTSIGLRGLIDVVDLGLGRSLLCGRRLLLGVCLGGGAGRWRLGLCGGRGRRLRPGLGHGLVDHGLLLARRWLFRRLRPLVVVIVVGLLVSRLGRLALILDLLVLILVLVVLRLGR